MYLIRCIFLILFEAIALQWRRHASRGW